jgi:FkbM family methyltransferase
MAMNASEFLKHKILGSSVGSLLHTARDIVEVAKIALTSPEVLGTTYNDQLATKLVTGLCLPNKVFVDVGAHIGSTIAAVLRLDASIAVIAVEAMPDKVAALRSHFPSIVVHQCAAGERAATASFYVDLRRSGYSSLSSKNAPATDSVKAIDVQVSTLDELISAANVDVIKIDVEGAELGVIRGAKRLIERCRPVVMFESGPHEVLGFTKEAIWQTFAEQQYAILVPNRVAHIDPGLKLDGFLESHLFPRRTTNYFAVPAERRDEIRSRARHLQGFPPA